MKGQVTNKYQQQIELFRITHYGRDPNPVRRMGYLIKAMFVSEESLKRNCSELVGKSTHLHQCFGHPSRA